MCQTAKLGRQLPAWHEPAPALLLVCCSSSQPVEQAPPPMLMLGSCCPGCRKPALPLLPTFGIGNAVPKGLQHNLVNAFYAGQR